MTVYEGKEPYIFISYAHKDASLVLPIVRMLADKGYRVWYDAGIEAGTEWPEYIATHLLGCGAMLAFISQNFDASHNCRREINFAIDKKKPTFAVYLEDFVLSPGMDLQLGTIQSIFASRYLERQDLVRALCYTEILKSCCENTKTIDSQAIEIGWTNADFLIEDGTLVKYRGNDATVEIPKIVNCIGPFAFSGNQSIKEVFLPPTVKTIENGAFFFCQSLKTVHFSENLFRIGSSLSLGETANDYFKNTYTTIRQRSDQGAFACCISLETVHLPQSVIYLGDNTFAECNSLSTVTLPDKLKILGFGVFTGCTALESIKLPATLEAVGVFAFKQCEKLQKVTLENGIQAIYEGAFQDCRSLTEITIPESVHTLGQAVFSGCHKLTSLTMPIYRSLWDRLLTSYGAIQQITLTVPSQKTVLCEGDFEPYRLSRAFSFRVIVPPTVTAIEKRTFCLFDHLISIDLANSLTEIPEMAFSGCRHIRSISLPHSVTTIHAAAFQHCISLTHIDLSNSLVEIAEGAFKGCTALHTVSLPQTLRVIKEAAFKDCIALQSIILPEGINTLADSVFSGCHELKNAFLPEGVVHIGNEAFYHCSSLAHIKLPQTLTYIDKNAFAFCEALFTVDLPNSLVDFAGNAFFAGVSIIRLSKKSPLRRRIKKIVPKGSKIRIIFF